ncbi:MAG: ABC transporter permease subunit [Planctomycetes bacterium]|nr:ABC transporter permease subunit [Planctomycetota bacterium]
MSAAHGGSGSSSGAGPASVGPRGGVALDLAALRRTKPTSRLLRLSIVLLGLLVVWAWTAGDFDFGDLVSERRAENVRRFLGEEITPYPLRETGFDQAAFVEWAKTLWDERGRRGVAATLSIAVLAIALAGAMALLLAPLAARNLATARPFEFGAARAARGPGWRALTTAVRALLVLLRAIPEYVWAFLFLAMLGPSAWPAVLALAIHNSGILGKLGAETIENLEARPLVALRDAGATRRGAWITAILPLSLARFLLYFFYRFETCVREATVLGMLGVVSLGYWIQDARSKHYYDEMLFFVALGAAIVLLGDLVSAAARAVLRRAR